MRYFMIIAALTAGNFIYGMWFSGDTGAIGSAVERSFFQALAVLMVAIYPE